MSEEKSSGLLNKVKDLISTGTQRFNRTLESSQPVMVDLLQLGGIVLTASAAREPNDGIAAINAFCGMGVYLMAVNYRRSVLDPQQRNKSLEDLKDDKNIDSY